MQVSSLPGSGTGRSLQAIAAAATRTGADFSFLLREAQTESGLNASARARTGSAAGLFQFVDQTWMSVLKRHGAEHGLAWAADAIEWVGGKLGVRDAETRAAVLRLKHDPDVAALMAGAHASDNKAGLEARLGRAVGAVDLYLAHFLGLHGATKFLAALALDPGAAAVSAAPQAAPGNHSVFYTHAGAARSLAEVYDRIAARFSGASPTVPSAPVPLAATGPALAYRQAADLLLAELGQ